MQNEPVLFQLVSDGDECLWIARLGTIEVHVNMRVNGNNEVVLHECEMSDFVPCEDADCPLGKAVAEMSGPEIDTCVEVCPFKTTEEVLGGSYFVWGDEPIGMLRAALMHQVKRNKDAVDVCNADWVLGERWIEHM